MSFLRKLTTRRLKTQPTGIHCRSLGIDKPPPRSTMPSQSYLQNDAPPAYSAKLTTVTASIGQAQKNADSPHAFLGDFDTVFVIDDSGSMAGRSWRETSAALSAITPICTEQDADGIDIYFLNHRNPYSDNTLGGYSNVTTTASVQEIFHNVRPIGGTPTGTRLHAILKPYLADVEKVIRKQAKGQHAHIKPLNIIVITDGVATDDVESVIVSAARKLDKLGAEPWQVGIQFFQVGQEPAAAEDLKELDDALSSLHDVRDIVDTVPWSGANGAVLTAEGILKATMGAIIRKLDRQEGSDECLRRK